MEPIQSHSRISFPRKAHYPAKAEGEVRNQIAAGEKSSSRDFVGDNFYAVDDNSIYPFQSPNPSITAPPQVVENRAPSEEAEEKQSNHALTVAIASAAAAEAAVAAAHAAAEVVRLTATPRSTHTVTEDAEKPFSDETLTEKENHLAHTKCEREIQESAAVKIQTSFRGYLARKALRALKGIVTLQAIIRGRAVRRQAVTTLKRLYIG